MITTNNKTEILIKNADKSDIPHILSIAKATWEPTYREILSKTQLEFMYDEIYTPASLENQMVELGHHFLLLMVGGKPGGYASFSPKSEADPKLYKLHKLYICPDLQSKNMGRTLLDAVEKEVRKLGGIILESNVNRYNPAIRFYERCGYVHHKEEDVPVGEFWMNDYVMRKLLR
jgi:GNAT superfamily N-acetyltransferase